MKLLPLTLLLALLGVSLTACSDDEPDDGGNPDSLDGLKSISIDPPDTQVEVQAGQASAQLTYRVLGTFEKGEPRDITDKATFTTSNTFVGAFQGPTFTSARNQGGTTIVTAKVENQTATARLNVKVRGSVQDPGSSNLPNNAEALFNGPANDARKPDLVYPNDGVLMPPNMRGIEVHFLPGASNTLFQLSFRNTVTDVTVYLRCTSPLNGGCIYKPDGTTWTWIAETNRGGEPVTVTLRGTDDTGTAVGTAATMAMSFSQDDLTGGLYYWTTSNGSAIMRYDFTNSTGTTSEKYVGAEVASGANCIGCHALSRDGKKIVAEANGQNDGRVVLLDVGRKALLAPFGTGGSSPDKSIFESWDPDGSQYAGVYADSGATDFNLMLFNGDTGKKTLSIAGTGTSANPANHPDFSPDSKHIAYVKVGVKGTNQRFGRGAIMMISKEASSWGTPVTLVPAQDGRNRFYPAFSPDGSFVVYNESTCATGSNFEKNCNADSDPSAKLFAVKAQQGATPINLARANARGKRDTTDQLTNSFPKWAPFVYKRTADPSTRLQWFTFSSTRQYGLRNPPGGGDENPRGTLLWISAVDPDAVARGEDGSYPAFVLPIQDITTSNHIAQWTTEVVPVIN